MVKELLLSEVEDLNKRKEIGERLRLYEDFICYRFFTEILKRPEFKDKSPAKGLPRVEKKLKEFWRNLWFSPDLKNELDALIEKTSYVHFQKGLKPADLGYGFLLFNSIIYEIAQKDEFIKENFLFITKFFKFVELSFYEKYYENPINRFFYESILQEINELFKAVKIHEKAVKVVRAWWDLNEKEGLTKVLKEKNIPLTPEECPLLIHLQKIEKEEIGLDKEILKKVKNLKLNWFSYLYKMAVLVEKGELKELDTIYEKFLKTSREILEALFRPIQDTACGMVLLINSGIKLLYKITEMIYEDEELKETREGTFINLTETIKETLKDTLLWAIEDLSLLYEKPKDNYYDIVHGFSGVFDDRKVYFCIRLYPHPYKPYIKDLVQLLLGISKLLILLKQRELDLVELANRAEAASKAKDMFLANMSHELRTPLNAILGFSQILQMRQDVPEHIKPYVEKIYIAGKTLLEQVNSILDFAKLEAGKIEFKPEKINIKDVLFQVIEIVKPLIQNKKLEFYYPQFSSFNLYVDPKLIKEVFLNLISNAIKFTPEGGKIWIEIKVSKSKKVYIFSVCDTGIGIKKEDIPKLFNPFTQLDNPFYKSTKGTGLGLAITKKLIELHKGEIWVESEYGKGTCFHFSIPVREDSKILEVLKAEISGAKNLLILEDSEYVMHQLKECLKNEFTLFLTNFSQTGLKILQEEKIDLIILDYFLADGIGIEILDYLSEKNSKIPVILISAESKVEELLNKHPYKNVRFLIKSGIDCNEVQSLVRDIILKKRD
ncbi:response regulator [Thermodesulfobacterium sp. TA1]|uniref:ATP-binding response regulator n=1 Tax=Thermodesulfobacterium sp. TA1 TaxID=2234087 RepID=UPI0012327D79|nr:ATP-binding protein [Thermodesulfobacterium sp. TA1]QER41633.1 response regulator [Thermodesulfobacterium sp. TA1]